MHLGIRRTWFAVAILGALPAIVSGQQPTTVTGRVTNAAGVALMHATVALPELGLGDNTRVDGRYTIVVPGARATQQAVTITVRLIGYKATTARVTLTGTVTQDFVLEANPYQLGEVVITGAGTATEVEKLGTARNSVSADLIVKSNEANVVTALAGKAPNVRIAASAGDPGAGSSITIRGLRTLNGSVEPLFVIDGVPMNNSTYSTSSFNPIDAGSTTAVGGQVAGGELQGTSTPNRLIDLNPHDIENIEILKGAAASAIYGARAANGVILITTKRGTSGQTRYSLRSSMTRDEVTRFYPLQTTYGQGLFNATSAATRSWGPVIAGQAYDHSREAFDTGIQSDNTLTVSGGNDRTTFYLSAGTNKNKGVFVGPHNYFNRSTVRMNASHHVNDDLVIGGNVSYSDTRGHFTQRGNNTNGLLLGLLRTPASFNNLPWLDEQTGLHRSYLVPNATLATAGQSRTFDNPFFVLHELLNDAQSSRSFGNINAAYNFNSWLKLNYTLGADYSNDERLEGCPAECSGGSVGGTVVEGKIVDYQIDHNLTATAQWRYSDAINGTLTLGQNLNARTYRTFSVVGRNLVAAQPFAIGNTLNRDTPSDYQTEIRNESYFGQVSADLYNQLFLTAALRSDGSSTFGADNRRSIFPKASAAWTFTNKYKPSFLSFGKVRLAIGTAGQEPEPYLTSATYSGTNLVGGISQGTGFGPTQSGLGGLFSSFTKPAKTLKPERTKELEGGFDIGFWNGKADFSATWFKSRTTDVILELPTAPSTGFSHEAKNAGIFSNSGAEFSLNLRPIRETNYSWDIGAGWGRNRSNVDTLAGADFLLTDNVLISTVAKQGHPIGVFQGNGWVRCGMSADDVIAGIDLAALCVGKPVGTVFIDDGTNGCANAGMPCGDDVTRVIGDPNPEWLANMHSTFRYKKFEFSGLLDIRHGGQVYNGTRGALWSYGTHRDTENRAICTGPANADCTGNEQTFGEAGSPYVGEVVGPGAGSRIPIGENWYRSSNIAACPFTGFEEPCLEDASFVKLRELSVAYAFDQPWVGRHFGLSSIDVRIAGRNLKTWTDYTGLDPETTVGGSSTRVGGTDYFNLPLTRSFVFTVGLNR
jgi:TonB-linked SusC/RagA family outer membrane protein